VRAAVDTIRARILMGLALLWPVSSPRAIAGAATLRQMRYAIEQELDGLRTSTEAGAARHQRAGGDPGRRSSIWLARDEPAREFQAAARTRFGTSYELDALGGLTVEDRLTVNRVSSSTRRSRPSTRSHMRSASARSVAAPAIAVAMRPAISSASPIRMRARIVSNRPRTTAPPPSPAGRSAPRR